MLDLFLQILGLVALLVGLFVGYRRLIVPRAEEISPQGQGLLFLVIMAMIGGFLGSPGWWLDDPRTFSWDLPPLAGRMLASAGIAFGVACYITLKKPFYQRVRLVLWMLFVYLVPLAVAILFFHLDYFDPRAGITYVFFIIVIFMTIASSWFLYRQPETIVRENQDPRPPSAIVQGWLSLIILVVGVWGIALFITDNGPIKLVWVWAGDLLSSRLIGSMLLTIATGAWYSRRNADTARVMLAAILTYAVGVSLASAWGAFFGKPVVASYLIVFAVIALVSAAMLRSNQLYKVGVQEDRLN